MILVVAEHHAGRLNRASLEAVAAAQAMDAAVSVVVPGSDIAGVVAELTALDVSEVVLLEHESLSHYTADGYVTALSSFVPAVAPAGLVLAHTYQTRDFAPRLAARLGWPFVPDAVAIAPGADGLVVTRPLFQGKVLADISLHSTSSRVVTVQLGAFRADAARRGATAAPVRTVAAAIAPSDIRQTVEPPFKEAQQSVDLTQADRIVAVGRGIKEQAHVALAEKLARTLGAEVAASRPICDAGWLPMDRQVGSSGQTVAPKLYLAIGVSGAIQHIVGMKGSKTIVAVNIDADAPIFEVATYGIVGDLFEVVPAMIAALGDA